MLIAQFALPITKSSSLSRNYRNSFDRGSSSRRKWPCHPEGPEEWIADAFCRISPPPAAAANTLGPAVADAQRAAAEAAGEAPAARGPVDVEGHTVVCKFTTGPAAKAGASRVTWTVYEDLRVRDGAITFVGSNGDSRVLTKSAEASFADEVR